MSNSSSQAPLTLNNLRQFNEEHRREDAHRKGFPTPSPEPTQQSSTQTPKCDWFARETKRIQNATESERARMFASKIPEREQGEETSEGRQSVNEIDRRSQHTSQPELEVTNHPAVPQNESAPTKELQERQETSERGRSDNEINNGSQDTSQPEPGTIDHPHVPQNGSALAAADSTPHSDEASGKIRRPKKPEIIHEPMSTKIQNPEPLSSQIHGDVCEVMYPGRKISSLTMAESADLRNMAEAVYPTWRRDLKEIFERECNEIARLNYPGKAPHTLDVTERARVKKERRDYYAHMNSLGGTKPFDQGKTRLIELVQHKQRGQAPDPLKNDGEFRRNYMESVASRGFGGQMAGVLRPMGNMAGPSPVAEPLQQVHSDIANSIFYYKDDALTKNHTVEKPLKRQPSEEFCSRLSDLFPPDFPRFQVAQNINDLGAYLANASYVISLGGSPVPDLKYGIIAVPLGQEKLLFDRSSQRDTMTPEFLQAVRDAQYFSRGDGSLHPIDSGEHQIHKPRYQANSESGSEGDIYKTNWVPVIDPGVTAKASGGIKRKRSDNPTADSSPDSQAVAILSGPARGRKTPVADAGRTNNEIAGFANDNVASVAEQTRKTTRAKQASWEPTPKIRRNVQTRASALKKEEPLPNKLVSTPKKATTTHTKTKKKPR